MPLLLTPTDYAHAAATYGIDARTLRAVTQIESGGRGGFLPDGQPRILFERHILWHRLQGREIDPAPLAADHPDLCGPHWDPAHYPYGAESAQWNRVSTVIAWAQNHQPAVRESYRKAAWESCSWGLFQVLGSNFQSCGFGDVDLFGAAMRTGEPAQLTAALRFMASCGALAELKQRNWPGFARIYNGPGQVTVYTARLKSAWELLG